MLDYIIVRVPVIFLSHRKILIPDRYLLLVIKEPLAIRPCRDGSRTGEMSSPILISTQGEFKAQGFWYLFYLSRVSTYGRTC